MCANAGLRVYAHACSYVNGEGLRIFITNLTMVFAGIPKAAILCCRFCVLPDGMLLGLVLFLSFFLSFFGFAFACLFVCFCFCWVFFFWGGGLFCFVLFCCFCFFLGGGGGCSMSQQTALVF